MTAESPTPDECWAVPTFLSSSSGGRFWLAVMGATWSSGAATSGRCDLWRHQSAILWKSPALVRQILCVPLPALLASADEGAL